MYLLSKFKLFLLRWWNDAVDVEETGSRILYFFFFFWVKATDLCKEIGHRWIKECIEKKKMVGECIYVYCVKEFFFLEFLKSFSSRKTNRWIPMRRISWCFVKHYSNKQQSARRVSVCWVEKGGSYVNNSTNTKHQRTVRIGSGLLMTQMK